jgi:hypothetical protein
MKQSSGLSIPRAVGLPGLCPACPCNSSVQVVMVFSSICHCSLIYASLILSQLIIKRFDMPFAYKLKEQEGII